MSDLTIGSMTDRLIELRESKRGFEAEIIMGHKNIAAVLVTAQLPAFAQPGQQIDVTVSSIGNAKSLRGGTLIATPLKGADGQIYAVAQGAVVEAI